jgi:Fe-S oxidoreductase
MAKLKYEFVEHYYRPGGGRRRPLRDYLFAHIGWLVRLGVPIAPLFNWFSRRAFLTKATGSLLGVSYLREYPRLSSSSLRVLSQRLSLPHSAQGGEREEVIFLTDPFTEYFDLEVKAGLAAYRMLMLAGCKVNFLPVVGSGRTMISKGFVRVAQKQAARIVAEIHKLDPEGRMPVVGVEPSEIYTLRDEYPDLLAEDRRVMEIANRSYMIDEFLVRPGLGGEKRILRIANKINQKNHHRGKILLHGHCYQKAQPPAVDGFPNGVQATVAMLEAVGYEVDVIEAGCCGMAGAFGYEAEHYDISMKIGELALFPAIRSSSKEVLVAAAGISCQAQIKDGTGRRPVHPIELI